MVIAGGYVWQDVYKVAFERNLTIVGGGDPVRKFPSLTKGKWLILP